MRADVCPAAGTKLTQRVRGNRLEVLFLILDVQKISSFLPEARAMVKHCMVLGTCGEWSCTWAGATGHSLSLWCCTHCSSPAGLLNRSWDNLLWGNEELEGRKEASWWFTCFNCSCCHQGGATGLWLSPTPTTTPWPAQQHLRVGGGLLRWG